MNTRVSAPPAALLVRPKLDPWRVAALVAAALVAVPILTLPIVAFDDSQEIWAHLASTVLIDYISNTFLLLVLVSIGTGLLGTTTAWLISSCSFPGRGIFEWALLIPLAMPAYVIAYVYTDLLEAAGPVHRFVEAWVGGSFKLREIVWLPEIRSLPGAAIMFTLVLYPYVYLLARSAFLEQSRDSLEVARLLGRNSSGVFWSISLPLARPAIAVGVALALMETVNDFGTVDFFGVATLSAGLYDVWLNMGSVAGAAQIGSLMLSIILLLVYVERAGRRNVANYSNKTRTKALRQMRLGRGQGVLAALYCSVLVLAGFALPAAVLLRYAWLSSGDSTMETVLLQARNSLAVASSVAILSVLLALLLGYLLRFSRDRLSRVAVSVASLGYAIPGPVLALGVIVPFAAFDNSLDALARSTFNVSTGLLLSGSLFALTFACVVRFLPIAFGGVSSSLEKISPEMEMASRSLGCTPIRGFVRVHIPLLRAGTLAGATVVFVDVMKELPMTLVLRPFNFDTLATGVYQFASDQQIEQAAAGALMIVVTGLLPVLILSRALSGSRRLESWQHNAST